MTTLVGNYGWRDLLCKLLAMINRARKESGKRLSYSLDRGATIANRIMEETERDGDFVPWSRQIRLHLSVVYVRISDAMQRTRHDDPIGAEYFRKDGLAHLITAVEGIRRAIAG